VKPTVAGALAEARTRGVALLDAQLLLARILATTRTSLIAHDERRLAAAESERWSAWLARRAAGEPLAYLLGEKEFHGLVLEVTPAVLVPRPETELLVEWAGELLRRFAVDGDGTTCFADLGTGSGAVALALKRLHPEARAFASDSSSAALEVARRNAARIGLAVDWREGSWWQPFGGLRFDVVASNPPYVADRDPHLQALRHEPIEALAAGGDGLDALRAIVADAPGHLAPGGWLVVEHGFAQGAAVRDLLGRAGFGSIETRRDLAGHERATAGRRANAA
jgi:release factor glutamine methyltransferase